MPIGFLNLAMLFGLAAVLIPPLIHLLSRRKFDVVPWAAMQFLEANPRTRRRVFFDDLLLMLVRMGLIALLVMAMAGPVDSLGRLSLFAGRGPRDVALVIDASASMGCKQPDGTAFDAALATADRFLADRSSADGVGVVVARARPDLLVGELAHDGDAVRSAVQGIKGPRDRCDGPAAVAAALRLLAENGQARREVVILTDGQRAGWADPAALVHWELLAAQTGLARPRVRIVNVAANRPADVSNWSVGSVRANRAVASVGQELTVRANLLRQGTASQVSSLKYEIDGKPEGDLTPPAASNDATDVTFSVKHRFRSAGSHLVTVRSGSDAMPGDNRGDLAVDVLPVLPVVIVEGDTPPSGSRRGATFLRDALSPARDPTPAVLVRTVPLRDFDSALPTRDLTGQGAVPRVLILADVPRLSPAQIDAVTKFLDAGGGVLVTLGERVDSGFYTRELYRDGRGWLPAAVGELPAEIADIATAPRPDVKTFLHSALDLFREPLPGGLTDVRVPRCWPLDVGTDGRSTVAARLSDGKPLFVEKPFGAGRVILSAIPLDNSWKTNLVELPSFAPLAHELVFNLAGSRAADANLSPGQPIRSRIPNDAPTGWVLETPDGTTRTAEVRESRITFADTTDAGVYVLRHPSASPRYFVVAPDPRESDLTPLSDADRARLQQLWPGLTFATDFGAADASTGATEPVELWWLVLLGAIALLASELWLTRRRALAAAAL